jgi:aromatic-L-amino-acid decarboxylase
MTKPTSNNLSPEPTPASVPVPFAIPGANEQTWQQYVEDFRRSGHEAVEWIASFLAHPRQFPVLPKVKPGELVDALPAHGPEKGESFHHIFADFQNEVLPAVTHWNHPGFMAYFGTTGSTPAIIGEMLAAALNTNGLHWKTSPAVAELEQVALGWLREWMGMPSEFFGMIFDTASTSSFHAMIAAREFLAPESREKGMPPGFTVYASDQAHSSIEKGAIALGVGQNNFRKIPVDTEFRARPQELGAMIRADIAAGKRPLCIVATVGTTSTTSIDPVPAFADIAERYNAWLHIDSAYAGVAAMLPEKRTILEGVERAHSLVVNAHKWLLTPIDCSAFYTRYPDALRRALSLVPEYLRASEDPRAVHLMDYGIPLGHRFRSLKLWFVLRYFGLDGLQDILRSHIELAQKFAAWIDADDHYERVAPVPFSVVCFRYKGTDDDNLKIIERVNSSGKVFLSHTKLDEHVVIRVAIGNLGTTLEDLELAWELLHQAAGEL